MRLLKAFTYAFNGLAIFFRHEKNGKIQLLSAGLVALLAWGLHVALTEWVVLLMCMATVLSFEMMNSGLEKLCNAVQPEYHPAIKVIKDISAAAVLCAAIFSAVIGVIIFLPKILNVL